ncbi:leucine-rich repeat protein [Levilactobacillus zymae]|nr:leucine-rich repeat protein [Levilactobacillus zymae]
MATLGVGAATTVPAHAATTDPQTATTSQATSAATAAQTVRLTPSSAASSAASSVASSTAASSQTSLTSSTASVAVSSAAPISAAPASVASAATMTTTAASTAPVSSGAASAAANQAEGVVTSSATSATSSTATSSGAPTSAIAAATAGTSSAAPASAATTKTPVALAGVQARAASATPAYTDSSVFNWQLNADGTATITGLNQKVSGVMSIPPTYTVNGKTYTVTNIGTAAFASDTGMTDDLTGVDFANGLTTIGDSAFAYLGNLQNVDFSANTTLTTIGNQAFVSSGIDQLVLPASVTTIGNEAFTYNKNLTSVTLPAGLTSLGNTAFASSEALTTVDLSQATQLTALSDHAFENDPLTSITIPANIQTIGANTFANNLSLSSVTFAPDSQLTSIGENAFIYDGKIKSLTLPANLQTIGNQAFLANVGLQSVTLNSQLQSIGDQAFTYDSDLNTLNLDQATQLKTIGNGAFEYNALTGNLTTPANLTSIGDYAFAGNPIDGLTLNNGLASVGDSAFIYNHLTGTLTIPNTVTTVGNMAFYGNELTGVTIPAGTTMGQDALSYNRITTLTGPTTTVPLANEQMVTAFETAPSVIPLTTLFTLDLGGLTTADLQLTNLSDGVTLQNGQLIIPEGVNSFSFDWALPLANSAEPIYSGHYTVVLDNPDIKVMDSTIFAGTTWTPSDNFVSAVTPSGTTVPLADLTIDGTVNPDVAGTYTVTYQYGTDQSTATIKVVKRSGTYTVTGPAVTQTYTGGSVTLNASQYAIVLPNPDGSTIKLRDGDLETPTATAAGTYAVTLSPQGIAYLNQQAASQIYDWTNSADTGLTYTITPAPVTITVADQTKYVGDADPVLTATVTNTAPAGASVNYTLARTAGEAAGTYTIQATPTDNPNYNVTVRDGTLTILPSEQSLTGSDYVMTVGDPEPTLTDFNATATNNHGTTIPVTMDLSQVDLTKAGTYNVVLSTTDGQSKTVTLTVNPSQQSLTGSGYTMTVGDPEPTLTDFNATATNNHGTTIPVTMDLSQVDLTKAGTYNVVLSTADGQSKTVTLTVNPSQQSLTGSGYTMTVGDPEPTLTDFNATATNNHGTTIPVTMDMSQVDLTKAGTYNVVLSTADGQSKTVTLTVNPSQQSLKGSNYTLTVGDPEPTLTDFNATATNNHGATIPVTMNMSQVDLTKAGTYNVVLSTADGQSKTVTLTVNPSQQSLTGSDYTMTVGDSEPTLADFNATATNNHGATIPVTMDLSQVDLTKAGTYNVVLSTADGQSKTVTLTVNPSQQSLTGSNYTMTVGDPEPTLTDFNATATDNHGTTIPVTMDMSQVDLTKAGTYNVVLSTADGQTKTVTLTVNPSQQSLTGSNYAMTVGDPEPTLTDFNATATNNHGTMIPVTMDMSQVDLTKAGTYNVVLSTTDGQSKTVTLTVSPSQQSLTGADYTMMVGDPEPTVTDFKAAATDRHGKALPVTLNLGTADLTQAGDYAVTLTTADGQSKTVTLHVSASKQSLTGDDYTMAVGDPTPTATSFHAQATDRQGAVIPVTVDLSQVDFTQPGTYNVGLSTTDGQSRTVTLTIVAPIDPVDPVTPTDPETPTTPVDPTTPTDPTTDHEKPSTAGQGDHPITPTAPVAPTTETPTESVAPTGQTTAPTAKLVVKHGHAAAQGMPTTPSRQATSAKAAQPTTPTTAKNATITPTNQQTKLPQTNEHPTTGWSLLGLILGALGLKAWRRQDRDQH